MRQPDRPCRSGTLPSVVVTATLVLALAVAAVPGATAVPDGDGQPVTPSQADVRAARQAAAARADEVGQIQARLTVAQQHLQEVQVAAMRATEAYNGAVYALRQARAEARAAIRRAASADRETERQRRALEGFAVGSASDATTLNDLTTLLSSAGPQQLLQDFGAWSDTASALQADVDRWDASRAVAEVMRQQADAARARQAEAAEEARAARDAARSAVASAAQQEASIQARTDELVRALAEAQHVSVRLARQRQAGLAAAAEQAAREAAEQAAEEAAEQAAQEAAEQAAQEAAEHAADDQPAHPQQPGTGGSPDPPVSPPPPAPAGTPAAIAFAQAQLGEPYAHGADGPDAWDCSGLTSQAWAAAGHPLSHWSVAQYSETTPITQSQLQPGDLVFWSDGSPSSIYHVAMYLGGDRIIQAPRPGRGVEIVSMYYWITPDLFGRVA